MSKERANVISTLGIADFVSFSSEAYFGHPLMELLQRIHESPLF